MPKRNLRKVPNAKVPACAESKIWVLAKEASSRHIEIPGLEGFRPDDRVVPVMTPIHWVGMCFYYGYAGIALLACWSIGSFGKAETERRLKENESVGWGMLLTAAKIILPLGVAKIPRSLVARGCAWMDTA